MREFFKGWKRIVGVVTLVMACVFAAGWVRSLVCYDVFQFPLDDSTLQAIGSVDSCVFWHSNQGGPVEQQTFAWQSIAFTHTSIWPKWDWSILGFSATNWKTGGYLPSRTGQSSLR